MEQRNPKCSLWILTVFVASLLPGGCNESTPKTSTKEYHLIYFLSTPVDLVVHNESSASHAINYQLGSNGCSSTAGFTPISVPAGSTEEFAPLQGDILNVAVDPQGSPAACSDAINLAFLDFRPIRCTISDGPAVECHRDES